MEGVGKSVQQEQGVRRYRMEKKVFPCPADAPRDPKEHHEQQDVQTEDDHSNNLHPGKLEGQVVQQDGDDPCTHVDGEPGGGEVEDPATPFPGKYFGRWGGGWSWVRVGGWGWGCCGGHLERDAEYQVQARRG